MSEYKIVATAHERCPECRSFAFEAGTYARTMGADTVTFGSDTWNQLQSSEHWCRVGRVKKES